MLVLVLYFCRSKISVGSIVGNVRISSLDQRLDLFLIMSLTNHLILQLRLLLLIHLSMLIRLCMLIGLITRLIQRLLLSLGC